MTASRWSSLTARLGLGSRPDVYEQLRRAYAEPHRHYHTVQHIDRCLEELDDAAFLADGPQEVEIALWFHDAIYSTRGTDNEIRSADWAGSFLRETGASAEVVANVRRHIRATQHRSPPAEPDSALVADIDLAILGSAQDTFQEFESQIRREYSWVPEPVYRERRARILRSFLEKEAIFAHPHFVRRYEEPARRNLEAAIRSLEN